MPFALALAVPDRAPSSLRRPPTTRETASVPPSPSPLCFRSPSSAASGRREAYFRAPSAGVSPADGVRGAGSALPGRDRLEAAFGAPLGGVRLHDGPDARAACESLGAEAYALGDDVAVRGTPSPHVLAHEVAHVVQQRGGGGRPLGEAGLEADAETAARAVGTEGVASVEGRAAAGAPQCFRLDPAASTGRPRLTAFVRDEVPKMVNDAWVMDAMNQAARNTGAGARDHKPDFVWGAGPLVTLRKMKDTQSGAHRAEKATDPLTLSEQKVDDYEKAAAGSLADHEFWLESTLLHEYVHFLARGKEPEGKTEEWGHEFEKKAYGMSVGSAASAKHVLTAKFGVGMYAVEVVGKEAGFKQRFRVADADTGTGDYDGKVGTSAAVTKTTKTIPPLNWTLTVQHDDGSGWKDSGVRKIRLNDDNNDWRIRSEDWTDRDFNDLELRVTKK